MRDKPLVTYLIVNICAMSRQAWRIKSGIAELLTFGRRTVTRGRIFAPANTIGTDVRVAPPCRVHLVTATATHRYRHEGHFKSTAAENQQIIWSLGKGYWPLTPASEKIAATALSQVCSWTAA